MLTSFLNARTYTVTSRHKALIVMGHHWMDSSQGGISCTNATEIVELGFYDNSTGLFYSIFTDFTSDTAVINYNTSQPYVRLTVIAVD